MRKEPPGGGSATRKRFFNQARPLTPYLSVETKGLTFIVETGDRLGRGLFVRRWRQDFRHLDRAVRLLQEHDLLQPQAVFVDVGANIGTTTVRAIRRHHFARAFTFEPEPRNFKTLRLNLVANDIDSLVTALQVAVSDREGEAELSVSARTSGEHTIVQRLSKTKSAGVLTVRSVTLDGLAERAELDPDAVGLLWVDAHGAEALVLAGSSALLRRGVPVVLALRPALPNWPETKETLVRLLQDYTVFADLRHGRTAPTATLAPLLDSLSKNGDMLAFRR